jgi:hypothetical protein
MKHRHIPQPVLGLATAFGVVALVVGASTANAAPAAAAGRAHPVHFRTPSAAMRYLASAYNRGDITALKKVTTPQARSALLEMRPFATNLRLESCSTSAYGHTICEFTHALPSAPKGAAQGHAEFAVAPADRHGWYMSVMETCG